MIVMVVSSAVALLFVLGMAAAKRSSGVRRSMSKVYAGRLACAAAQTAIEEFAHTRAMREAVERILPGSCMADRIRAMLEGAGRHLVWRTGSLDPYLGMPCYGFADCYAVEVEPPALGNVLPDRVEVETIAVRLLRFCPSTDTHYGLLRIEATASASEPGGKARRRVISDRFFRFIDEREGGALEVWPSLRTFIPPLGEE